MADEERERTSDCEVGKDFKGKDVNNGNVFEIEYGVGLEGNSASSSGDCVRTYTRRKRLMTSSSYEEKSFKAGKASGFFAFLQAIKEPENMCLPSSSCNQVNLVRMGSHASANGSEDCSAKDWRKVALEQMYQSLNDTECGLQECIRDALSFHPEVGCTNKIKESVQSGEEMCNGTQNGSQNTYEKHVCVMSNGSTNESVVRTSTDQCKRMLLDVLISTKFSELCDLLFEHFQGLKVDKLFDINWINTRIKEGVYESSPMLFNSDIQKIWTKLQKVGTEMVSLAKSLSGQSSAHDQVLIHESNGHPEVEQMVHSHQYRIGTCRQCSGKTDGRECIVCNYCKEIYHVSCIGSDAQDIPLKSWCCLNCRVKGIGSLHENCVLCECLKALKSSQPLVNEEELDQEESTDDLEQNGLKIGEETLRRCNMCKNELENDSIRVCGHPFCSNKYYHERCLSVKQLNTYGSCWYCPSCLCRRCLTDRDDDKIVLCDGCDKAFHIYCMQPPLTSIPKGKWFCIKCDQGLQRLRKVKMAYSDRQYKSRKKAAKEKITYENLKNIPKEMGEDLLYKSGGVDMLLTAAKTLNYEENLAAQGFNY